MQYFSHFSVGYDTGYWIHEIGLLNFSWHQKDCHFTVMVEASKKFMI